MKYTMSMSMSGRRVLHVAVGRGEEVLIPEANWERADWREAFLRHHPEVNAAGRELL